jgi:hypothetical protein
LQAAARVRGDLGRRRLAAAEQVAHAHMSSPTPPAPPPPPPPTAHTKFTSNTLDSIVQYHRAHTGVAWAKPIERPMAAPPKLRSRVVTWARAAVLPFRLARSVEYSRSLHGRPQK